MKRFAFLIFLIGITDSIFAQIEENLFEWQTGHSISVKEKFLTLYEARNLPLTILNEYNISVDSKNSYVVKTATVENEMVQDMIELKTFDSFEIYHNGKKILTHIAGELLHNVESITRDTDDSPFIKVPLSGDSFALFFGGWPYDGGDAPELVIAIVSGGIAKVVYDNRALAYKYTPTPDFSIEFVETVGNLYEKHPLEFTDSFLKERTKYKIWKEGNMLKYKSWK